MYLALFEKLEDALEALPPFPENARTYEILQGAMQDAEDIYCEAETEDD
ncbi:hypothetical protein [uncultured Dysosmobacter sp.]|nr:hypothetical protein [uncultured Dysosmobacter sp.]